MGHQSTFLVKQQSPAGYRLDSILEETKLRKNKKKNNKRKANFQPSYCEQLA